jgi:ATP-dependent RNA helicase DDX1
LLHVPQAIIFCRTKLDCDNLEQYLTALGGANPMANEFTCACLHSDRRVEDRRANLQKFKVVFMLVCMQSMVADGPFRRARLAF